MISYDILQNLENNCFELLNATTGMISGSNEKSMGKSHQNIVRALRKIVIANEMMGKGIICISGLQGAGKSTLMKNFYGLSDEYFNIKTGVGEKIPVFICENGECKGPEMYAMTLEKQDAGTYIRKNVKMNAEDFRNASSGEETNLNIMYLELRVPYKHLNNESYAFMLLPGFEKKNDYWRSLIDFSVKCSDTSIFVFNESSFSKYDNQVLLDKIHERFGESLIYAISQSDLSEDNNATVKNTCIDVMKISKGEEDRVICVGEYENETDNERWIVELKRAIEKYCNSIETARKNCTQYIYEIIEDELRPELSAIKDALGSDTGDMLESHLENSSYLKAFDQVVKDRRKKIETKLDSTLDKSFISSRDRLEKIFSDSSYAKELGVKDERIIRRTVFGENVKDIKRARARVEAALKRENGVYDFQYAFFDAITETSLEAVDDNECRHILLEDQQSELSVFEESVDIVLSEESIAKRQNILFDVAALLSKTNNMPQPKHNNPAETMKVIAELGAEHFGLATLNKSSEENSSLIIPETIGDRLYKGGLFSRSAKQSDFVDLMYDLIDAFIVQLKSEVIEQINLQKRAVKEISEDYLRYKQWKTESERNIANNTERMALIDKEIEIIKEKIESIEERREADKEIIDDYLRIADTEFVKYKNSLLEMLDSDTFSTEEKVILLIYLCIIEKDFQSITEMG